MTVHGTNPANSQKPHSYAWLGANNALYFGILIKNESVKWQQILIFMENPASTWEVHLEKGKKYSISFPVSDTV